MQPPLAGSPTDVTKYVVWDTWYVQEEYGRQGATAYFELNDEFEQTAPHETNLTLLCKTMAEIVLTDTTLDTTLFSGLLTDPTLVFLSATLCQYQCNCRDWTYMSDSRLVNASYLNMTAGAIITDLVNNSNTGLTPDPDMPAGPIIDAVQFQYVSLSDAIDQISQLASWESDYAFWVGYDLVLHWGNEQNAVVTGITVTDAVTTPSSTTIAYVDKSQTFTYEWDGTTLRNSCTVRGGFKTQDTTEPHVGDGTTQSWPLSFDLDQGGDITVTVDGVGQTVEVSATPASSTKQFVIYQSPAGSWFLLVGTGATPGSGVTVSVEYTANIPIIGRYQDSASIIQYDGPNGGIFEFFVSDNTLLTSASAYSRARAEVVQFGDATERFTFSISEDWPGDIHAGEAFYLISNYIPDAEDNWFVGITDYYIVVQNQINGRVGNHRRYDIVAVRVTANS